MRARLLLADVLTDHRRIRLERTECAGGCPSYSVEIAGDGTVVYEGRACVAIKGERRAAIPVASVRSLFARFQDTGYFTLRDTYFSRPVDVSGVVTGSPTTNERYCRAPAGNAYGSAPRYVNSRY